MTPAIRAGRWRPVVAALAVCVLFVSCTLTQTRRVAPHVYDLGQPASGGQGTPRVDVALLVPAFGSPAWLDTTGITYRLAYEDPTRVRTYADSRWVDTPALLLTEQLRNRLAAVARRVVDPGDGTRSDYALRVDVEDFSQTFDAPGRSRVRALIRASLVDLGTHDVQAQATFQRERQAAPNASGAAAALADASRELLDNVLDWTAQKLKNKTPHQTGSQR